MNWQPIETAPKDRNILVAGRMAVFLARWDDQQFHEHPKPYFVTQQSFGVGWNRDNSTKLTHWMELPELPEAK